MKLYSGTSKDVPKSAPFNYNDQEVDIVYITKQTQDKFKYNTLLALGGITLFLLGVYFLIATIFLHTSSGISKNDQHVNNSHVHRSVLSNYSSPNSIFYNLRTIDLHIAQKTLCIKNKFFNQNCKSDYV